jgi:hypothetical protein
VSATRYSYLVIVIVLALSGCGRGTGSASSPSFREQVAILRTRVNTAGERCHDFDFISPEFTATTAVGFCEPFYDRNVVVMGISAGVREDKTLVGMMPFKSTRFVVGLSDGKSVNSTTDEDGFFALGIATSAEIVEVRISVSGSAEIVCAPIDIDSPPCK